jgi:hypothetical protein
VYIRSTDVCMSRILPDIDPTTISGISSIYSSFLVHLDVTNPKRTRYSELFESLLEQVITRRDRNRSSNHPHEAAEPTTHGLQMDWMNTSFEQSVLDASCSFDLASLDHFMLDHPYLVDHDENLGW